MSLRITAGNVYLIEMPIPASAVRITAANVYAVEMPTKITGAFTKLAGVWREFIPYVNLPGLRITQGADQRVTENGVARKIEPKDSGAAWVAPFETWVKRAGQWKRVLPSKYAGEP